MHYSNVKERVQLQFSQIVEDFLRQREGRMSALHPLLFEISSEVAQFGSIWVNLGQFGSIWVNLGQFGSIVRLDPKTFSFLKGTILKDPQENVKNGILGYFWKKEIFFFYDVDTVVFFTVVRWGKDKKTIKKSFWVRKKLRWILK